MKGIEVIAPTNGDVSSSYIWFFRKPWKQLGTCGWIATWGQGISYFLQQQQGSFAFLPCSEVGMVSPLSLALLISELQYCLSLSPRNLIPYWLFLDNPFGFKGHKTSFIPLINVQLWDEIHSWLRSVRVTSGINQVVPLDMYELASVARTAIKECAFPFQLPLH